MKIDAKNYYLATTLAENQCMLIPEDLVPEETLQACNIKSKMHNNKMLMIIDKGLWGLKEIGKLANK